MFAPYSRYQAEKRGSSSELHDAMGFADGSLILVHRVDPGPAIQLWAIHCYAVGSYGFENQSGSAHGAL
eukprot:2109435-Pleurochrysis_carterae.AAC.1